MIEAGQIAPDFTLPDQAGTSVTLSHFRGQHVVVYFYPKDDTPGCTKEACSFRDHWDALQAHQVVVLGVSPDDTDSHAQFASKYQLPVTLLADTEKNVARLYGTWGEKNMYGKTVTGMLRTTFLIDPDGLVKHVWKKPKNEVHAQEVLAKLS
jgi:peroxiredoxin Q/BCP